MSTNSKLKMTSLMIKSLTCTVVPKRARLVSPSSEGSLNTAANTCSGSVGNRCFVAQAALPVDILYKKQTVSAGRVHKHSKHKPVETTACQFPCAIRW